MTAVTDQKHGLALLEKRLAETTNDRHRAVLNAVLKHLVPEAEPVWDVDQIMATLTPEPAYHIWVNGVDVGPKGAEAVARSTRRRSAPERISSRSIWSGWSSTTTARSLRAS
jgi:hypothetical protein